MTEKRFKHTQNRLGMQFISYDDTDVLLGTFADAEGITHIVELLNTQHEENTKLKAELKNLRRLANEVYMEDSK